MQPTQNAPIRARRARRANPLPLAATNLANALAYCEQTNLPRARGNKRA